MSDAPYTLTVAEGLRRRAAGTLTAEEWAASCADRVASQDGDLHAFVAFDRDVALRQARAVDAAIAAGRPHGRLSGVPIGVKDVFNTIDYPTRMGSPIWEGFTPGNDARVVHAMKMEGAVVLGKTVTAEFAVHHPGPTRNPHSAAHSPGTSSSGSAAAVAASMVPLALGTQTAGSTIRPASYCGVFGFKPSFGLIPRTGVLKTLDTLDHVAFFARAVDDLELAFEGARVRGGNHPYVKQWVDDDTVAAHVGPWRIAVVRGPVWDEATPYAQHALQTFSRMVAGIPGVDIDFVDLPAEFADAHAVHEGIYEKALSYYFREEYEQHPTLVSARFREMVERGAKTTPDEYRAGLARQEHLTASLDAFFDRYDVILNLSTAAHAPEGLDGRDIRDNCLIWTMCHAPAISLPVFQSPAKLPFGAQIVARRYRDRALLAFAALLGQHGLLRDWRTWTVEPS